jgi:hypothetical protein
MAALAPMAALQPMGVVTSTVARVLRHALHLIPNSAQPAQDPPRSAFHPKVSRVAGACSDTIAARRTFGPAKTHSRTAQSLRRRKVDRARCRIRRRAFIARRRRSSLPAATASGLGFSTSSTARRKPRTVQPSMNRKRMLTRGESDPFRFSPGRWRRDASVRCCHIRGRVHSSPLSHTQIPASPASLSPGT